VTRRRHIPRRPRPRPIVHFKRWLAEEKRLRALAKSYRPPRDRAALKLLLIDSLEDIGWGLLWAALLVAIVLFSSGATEFIYIDF
jgi:hypothetical protein